MKYALSLSVLSFTFTTGLFNGVSLASELDRASGLYVGRAHDLDPAKAAWFMDRPDAFTVHYADDMVATRENLAQRLEALAALDLASDQAQGGQAQALTAEAQGAAAVTARTQDGPKAPKAPKPQEGQSKAAPAQEAPKAPAAPATAQQ